MCGHTYLYLREDLPLVKKLFSPPVCQITYNNTTNTTTNTTNTTTNTNNNTNNTSMAGRPR